MRETAEGIKGDSDIYQKEDGADEKHTEKADVQTNSIAQKDNN